MRHRGPAQLERAGPRSLTDAVGWQARRGRDAPGEAGSASDHSRTPGSRQRDTPGRIVAVHPPYHRTVPRSAAQTAGRGIYALRSRPGPEDRPEMGAQAPNPPESIPDRGRPQHCCQSCPTTEAPDPVGITTHASESAMHCPRVRHRTGGRQWRPEPPCYGSETSGDGRR